MFQNYSVAARTFSSVIQYTYYPATDQRQKLNSRDDDPALSGSRTICGGMPFPKKTFLFCYRSIYIFICLSIYQLSATNESSDEKKLVNYNFIVWQLSPLSFGRCHTKYGFMSTKQSGAQIRSASSSLCSSVAVKQKQKIAPKEYIWVSIL